MVAIQRTRVLWSGFSGAPGYTNLFASVDLLEEHDPNIHADDVATLFEDLGVWIPADVTLSLDPEVTYFESTTGEVISYDVLSRDLALDLGSAVARAGAWVAPTGAAIDWRTQGVRDNRRVRGRTFIVPLLTTAYQNDGTLSPGFLASARPTVAAYVNDSLSRPIVWSRPREATQELPAREGATWPIVAGSIVDRVAVLRSRRD